MNRIKSFNSYFIFTSIFLLIVCFSSMAGGSNTPENNDSNEMNKMYMQKLSEIDRKITTAATKTIKPSLDKKENVDFILTPALLIQEIMSDEIIITYPTE